MQEIIQIFNVVIVMICKSSLCLIKWLIGIEYCIPFILILVVILFVIQLLLQIKTDD
jgi:hypothetical protein